MFQLFRHPCLFLKYTGFYCPGCGGTRSVLYLLSGNIVESFFHHPIVPYIAILFVWYLVGCVIRVGTGNRYGNRMRFRDSWLWIGLAIILINWILQNILLLYGIRLK